MNVKSYCRVLVVLMLGCLLCVLLIPGIRMGKAAWPISAALVIGVAVNLLYIRIRNHQVFDFLEKGRRVRRLFRLCLSAPLILVLVIAIVDIYERRMPLFKDAVSVMEESDVAERDLGVPIKIGWPIEGSTEETPDSGHSNLLIPVSGTLGRGSLRVVGTKSNGAWKISELTLILRNGSVRESLPTDAKR